MIYKTDMILFWPNTGLGQILSIMLIISISLGACAEIKFDWEQESK